MESTIEFDFAKTAEVYNYNISPNINLSIKRLDYGVAILYFTNNLDEKINLPDEIVVYEYDFQNKNKKSILKRTNKQIYPLAWTDDYSIVFNNTVILEIKSQRKWNIIA